MSGVITTCSGNPEGSKKKDRGGAHSHGERAITAMAEKGHGRRGFSDKKRVNKYSQISLQIRDLVRLLHETGDINEVLRNTWTQHYK